MAVDAEEYFVLYYFRGVPVGKLPNPKFSLVIAELMYFSRKVEGLVLIIKRAPETRFNIIMDADLKHTELARAYTRVVVRHKLELIINLSCINNPIIK